MPHPRAPNQIPLTEQLYLFQSVASGGSPDCLIDAHGIAERSAGGPPMFTLPAGLTLQFYVPHGDTLYGTITELLWRLKGRRRVPMPPLIRGPALVHNYTLWKYESYSKLHPDQRYLALHRAMEQGIRPDPNTLARQRRLIQEGQLHPTGLPPWAPHVVTLRNRSALPHQLKLSDAIFDIQRARPEIRHFHAYCCRGETPRFDTWPYWLGASALGGTPPGAEALATWGAWMDASFGQDR